MPSNSGNFFRPRKWPSLIRAAGAGPLSQFPETALGFCRSIQQSAAKPSSGSSLIASSLRAVHRGPYQQHSALTSTCSRASAARASPRMAAVRAGKANIKPLQDSPKCQPLPHRQGLHLATVKAAWQFLQDVNVCSSFPNTTSQSLPYERQRMIPIVPRCVYLHAALWMLAKGTAFEASNFGSSISSQTHIEIE